MHELTFCPLLLEVATVRKTESDSLWSTYLKHSSVTVLMFTVASMWLYCHHRTPEFLRHGWSPRSSGHQLPSRGKRRIQRSSVQLQNHLSHHRGKTRTLLSSSSACVQLSRLDVTNVNLPLSWRRCEVPSWRSQCLLPPVTRPLGACHPRGCWSSSCLSWTCTAFAWPQTPRRSGTPCWSWMNRGWVRLLTLKTAACVRQKAFEAIG